MDAATLLDALTNRSDTAISEETRLADVRGWDSLQMVRLVIQLETRLGRELTDTELENLESISDVKRILNGA